MVFRPINKHIEVEPMVMETIIERSDHAYEEKGMVISVADDTKVVNPGQTVYFDSYLCAKYPDNSGKTRYLVPEDAVRAVET